LNTADSSLLRRYRAEVFAATWLSYAGFYVCRRVYSVLKQPLKEQFGFDDVHVAWPWTVYLIAYMLGQFLAAWLGRHIESRRVLAYAMTVTAACNMALGFLVDAHVASVFLWMCVLMAIHGLAQAMGWPHNVGLFANWTRRAERGTLFGIWGTCYQIGSVIGKGLAGFLFGWLGMAWSFFGASIVFFAITVIFVFWARERPQSVGLSLADDAEPDVPAGEAHSKDAQRKEPLPHGFLRLVIAIGIIYFGFKFVRYAIDSWSTLILGEQFHLSPTRAAYLSTAFDWIGFLGVVAAGFWSDRTRGSRRLPVVFWLALACFASTTLMWFAGLQSVIVFVALLGLVGFTLLGPDSLLSGACAMDAGSRRQAALAAGVINGLGSIGPIVQEPSIGWIKQTYGVHSVFLLLVGIMLVTTVATGLLAWSERGRL